MRDKQYEKPPLSDHQLEIFKRYHQMDCILYELSLAKFERRVATFGQDHSKSEFVRTFFSEIFAQSIFGQIEIFQRFSIKSNAIQWRVKI